MSILVYISLHCAWHRQPGDYIKNFVFCLKLVNGSTQSRLSLQFLIASTTNQLYSNLIDLFFWLLS